MPTRKASTARCHGERIDNGKAYETKGRPKVALWNTTQWPSSLNALYQMEAMGHRVRYLGLETLEKQQYHRILLTLSNGWESYYYVHPESFQLVRSRNVRRFHAVDKNIRRIETQWSDFRDVAGLKIPYAFREVDIDTGEVLSEGTSLSFKLNLPIPRRGFRYPGGSPFRGKIRQNRPLNRHRPKVVCR